MLPRNHPDRIQIAFDDHRLVANAGLILPATLALRLGLPQLLRKHLDLGGAPGRANTGDKMMTLVASALAGGDCIDDADVLRAGGTARVLGFTAKAPSTLGTFLRSLRWGHVRQLDRVSRELLARVWKAGAGPGDAPFTIDLDSTICETYGLAKEGARHHGYTGARGYHPLLAVAAGTGDVLMARLREGRANTARGAAHFLRETVGRVRYCGARGQLTVRADSGFYTHAVVAVCRRMDVRFSIAIRQRARLRNLIEAIPEDAWTPIPYWMDGAADVAETTYTPFQAEADAAPVRLIALSGAPVPLVAHHTLLPQQPLQQPVLLQLGGSRATEAVHQPVEVPGTHAKPSATLPRAGVLVVGRFCFFLQVAPHKALWDHTAKLWVLLAHGPKEQPHRLTEQAEAGEGGDVAHDVGGVQPLLSGAYTQRLDDPLRGLLESQPATVVLHQANSEVV